MTGPLVLPQDVEIISLARLPAAERAKIQVEDGGYAITRPRSRVPSKVINAQAAQFLREFETPTTLVDAIRRFSRATEREAGDVLEEVYPFLESCLLDKLLVEPGQDSQIIRASFNKDEVVVNCEVRECIQVLDDTELYRVRTENLDGALKIARPGSDLQVKRGLEREIRILRRLNGEIAPRLLFSGETEDGRTYLVMEWIQGEPSGDAAFAMRRGGQDPLPASLQSLCAEILDMYARLHTHGIVHADVHANNVLITKEGRVRVIDFGSSQIVGDNEELEAAPRAGVGFFFEPEYANAVLRGFAPPPASPAGDQYAAAALVYFLLSGHYYLDFSYGKETVLGQIAEQAYIPLAARGLPRSNVLDEVLGRALSKDPFARFPDMAAMETAFRLAIRSLTPAPDAQPRGVASSRVVAIPRGSNRDRELWLEAKLNSLSNFDLSVTGMNFPSASLMSGSTWIAYCLLRIAGVRADAELLALGHRWLDLAERQIREHSGFYHDDVNMSAEPGGRISPFSCASGVAFVHALLAHSAGDLRSRSSATRRFLEIRDKLCRNMDPTTAVNTLLAVSGLVDAFRGDSTAEVGHLVEAGDALYENVLGRLDGVPEFEDPESRGNSTLAHFGAGDLYAVLRWMRSTQRPVLEKVRFRLQQLADASPWAKTRGSPDSPTNDDGTRLAGWCSGSAALVFLWTLASQLDANTELLASAEAVGRHAFQRGVEEPSLHCGLMCNAYSQLNLYKNTGDPCWLDNAIVLADIAVKNTMAVNRTPEPHLPCFCEGEMGLAVLIAELERPGFSAMPFLEAEAWPTHLSLS